MKKIMILIVGLFVVINVFADSQENNEGTNYTEVPIVGAFGLTIGEVVPDDVLKKVIPGNIRNINGNTVYLGIPLQANSFAFTFYSLTVTPKTKKIAKIEASFSTEENDVLQDFKKDFLDAITAKYGVFTTGKGNKYGRDYEKIVFINKNMPKRKITIASEKNSLRIEYADLDMLKSEIKFDFTKI